MSNEADLGQVKKRLYEQHARTVVNNLQGKNIDARYVPDRREALVAILQMVPPAAVVARGDSVTLEEIGILTELRKRGQNEIIDPFERGETGPPAGPETGEDENRKRQKKMKAALTADIFLTGSSAVTLDGKLVNVDGGGNRVGAMIYGPEKVIVVAGANKIVTDVDEALKRIHNIAAPLNAMRHYLKHHDAQFGDLPCVKASRCVNCNHEWKICRFTVIIDGVTPWQKGRINVVLVGEELGI